MSFLFQKVSRRKLTGLHSSVFMFFVQQNFVFTLYLEDSIKMFFLCENTVIVRLEFLKKFQFPNTENCLTGN